MRSTLVIGLLSSLVASSASPQCRTPEHRQFDFWIGDWDAYDLSDTAKAVARVQVTSIMDGCALQHPAQAMDSESGYGTPPARRSAMVVRASPGPRPIFAFAAIGNREFVARRRLVGGACGPGVRRRARLPS